MKEEAAVRSLGESYKQQLLLAIEEKSRALTADPRLDLLILSLMDRLETLEWVLDDSSRSQPLYYAGLVKH